MSTLFQKPNLTHSSRVAATILAVAICLGLVTAILTGSAFFQGLWWCLLVLGAVAGASIIWQAIRQDCQAYAWCKLFRITFSIIVLIIVFTSFA